MASSIVCGVDFGGTRTKIGIVDIVTGTVIDFSIVDTPQQGESALLQCLKSELERICLRQHISKQDILGIGVSIGCYVFKDTGTLDSMCGFINLPDQYPIKTRIEEALGLPCFVDNDARLIGLAEAMFGAGDTYKRVLTLTLGTGVGIGFTIDKKIQDGSALIHLAGHIKVREIEQGEQLCYCGIPGCLESTVSGVALQNTIMHEFGCDNEHFFKLANAGDKKAVVCLERYIDFLVVALNQYVYLYAPDAVILAGGVAKGLTKWIPMINHKLTARVHSQYTVDIKQAKLMEDGGIIGAALLFSKYGYGK